nr:hypothetical protein [uncultured Bacillus sp.]
MSPIIIILMIIIAVLADYFWFGVDRKRWGWMKNWSTVNKRMFFSGFIIVSILIYLGLSIKYV